MHAEIIDAPFISQSIWEDPDDDEFLTCAAAGTAGNARVVVSGDKHLRAASGWRGVDVKTPKAFVDRH